MNTMIASALKHRRRISPLTCAAPIGEQAEFALAYLDGRIMGSQVAAVLGCTHASVPSAVVRMLRAAISAGVLRVQLVEAADADK